MDKPAILSVDDEPAVLSAVARDLRRQYGDAYRILRADSGSAALEALEQLKLRGDTVALLLADQRMPSMSGVEFLEKALELVPDAKRALLTAYADTDAAIKAINDVHVDHYLMKPWDPPEEKLYPILDEMLDDWQAEQPSTYEGVRIVGHRWSAASHVVKDFLARAIVPYHWLDVETDDEARELLKLAELDTTQLPVAFFPDGSHLVQPSTSQIAERVGLRTQASLPSYDLVIVGGGPAGMGAAVYGASEGLSTLMIEKETTGGQAGTSSFIENYLGFTKGIRGDILMLHARDQATRFGTEILVSAQAQELQLRDPHRVVRLTDGTEVSCRAVVIASGVQYRKLDAPGVERLEGAGIFYGAATTEARDCKGKDIFVVGGGNSAGQAAMHLSNFARSVSILIRGPSLSATMSQYLIDRIKETENISVCANSQVVGADGGEHLESLLIAGSGTDEPRAVPAWALFIFIGAVPRTDWVEGVVQRDDYGFIPTGVDVMTDGKRPRGWWADRDPFWLESSVPGVFVAGDVRSRSIKRIASAVGEGSMAVTLVHQHLAGL